MILLEVSVLLGYPFLFFEGVNLILPAVLELYEKTSYSKPLIDASVFENRPYLKS